MMGTPSPALTPPRPPRPSRVQTVFQSQSPASFPHNSASPSSRASTSTSQFGSPCTSPGNPVLTSSSAHPSPEPQAKDCFRDPFPPTLFQLPDPVAATKQLWFSNVQQPRHAGYMPAVTSNHSALTSAAPTILPASVPSTPSASTSSGGLIRRLSSRAQLITGRRRPSFTPQRGSSVGPCIFRRRSDSAGAGTGTDWAAGHANIFSDSDEDTLNEKEAANVDLNAKEPLPSPFMYRVNDTVPERPVSAHPITLVDTVAKGAPMIPSLVQQGTVLRKVSGKNRAKYLIFRLEASSGKIVWVKSHPDKCIFIDYINEIRVGSDIRQYCLDFGVPSSEESRWFSIFYSIPETKKSKVMHLIAKDASNFRDWTETLDALSRYRLNQVTALMNFDQDAVRNYWLSEISSQFATRPRHTQHAEELDFAHISSICKNLHIHAAAHTLIGAFKYADQRRVSRLNFSEFQNFLNLVTARTDLGHVYHTVASNRQLGLTADEFLAFVRNEQREDVDSNRPHWDAVFARNCSKFALKKSAAGQEGPENQEPELELRMSELAFSHFLTSPDNSYISPQRPPSECKLDRPVNEYFISSSHNTYLLGRQVVGQSTVEGYIYALTRGCRSIEVDCWDGPSGQPLVNHGRTFTSSISFQEVITTINKYAFYQTRFPLWISLEVHCSPPQQAVMVTIMKATFGSRLVTELLDPSADELPSPSQLMDRILIKVKKSSVKHQEVVLAAPADAPTTPRTTASTALPFPATMNSVKTSSGGSDGTVSMPSPTISVRRGRKGENMSPSPFTPSFGRFAIPDAGSSAVSRYPSLPQSFILSPSLSPKKSNLGTGVNAVAGYGGGGRRDGFITEADVSNAKTLHSSSGTSDNESSGEKASGSKFQKSGTAKTIPMLGDLGVYCAGFKFRGFNKPEAYIFNHIFSLTESALISRAREERKAVDRHNMRYLMRVYPNRTRVTSNNLSPLTHWRRGVQMVALNWQTLDIGLQLNRAMFEGGSDWSGYVLKPRELRDTQVLQDKCDEHRERNLVTFSIDIMSVRHLMRPSSFPAHRSMDPYVEVDVFHASDKRDKKESISSLSAMTDSPLKMQTDPVRGNGFNPTWRDAKSKFKFKVTTKYPDLIFVRWSVKLAPGSETYATFSAKLCNLKNGYRTLPLLRPDGEQFLFTTLLCRISLDSVEKVTLRSPGETMEPGSKLREIGRTVFNRTYSPKTGLEKPGDEA